MPCQHIKWHFNIFSVEGLLQDHWHVVRAAIPIDEFALLNGTTEKKIKKGWRKGGRLGGKQKEVADPIH